VRSGLVATLLIVLTSSLVLAAEPQFGRWAVDAQHCSGDTKAGPLVITANSASLASETCTFGKMYKADRGLYIEGRCSNGARHPISLEMKGDRLIVRWSGEPPQEMRRCG
jgi:hypothetical protein